MEKRWNILTADADKVQALQAALKIHPLKKDVKYVFINLIKNKSNVYRS